MGIFYLSIPVFFKILVTDVTEVKTEDLYLSI